jgi:hypothetical protein
VNGQSENADNGQEVNPLIEVRIARPVEDAPSIPAPAEKSGSSPEHDCADHGSGFNFKEELRFLKKVVLGIVAIPLLPFILFRELRKPTATSDVNPGVAPVEANLYAHVDALTKLDRSHENLAGLDAAAGYIEQQWRGLGLEVTYQDFACAHGTARNLITSFGPQDAPVIVVGAHYDVCTSEGSGREIQAGRG